jgi:hypothetical protein
MCCSMVGLMCQRSTVDGTGARQMCCSSLLCVVYWRTTCNGSVVHKACCSSWCDVACFICKPHGKALDQMWCWSQQSKAWMNPILPKTLPSGLRRWLKAPFRKGGGSDPTCVILFGLILRHDVLHTWSGPYIQRAPATLGPGSCFTNCCLAQTTPGIIIRVSFSKGAARLCGRQGQHRLHQPA